MIALLAIVAVWAFAEATLFFIVADVPISAIGLTHGPGPAVAAALVASAAAGVGGYLVAAFSAHDPQGTRAALLLVPGIGPAMLDDAVAAWAGGGWTAMAAGAFRGVPYKLYAHAAGLSGSADASFVLASTAARLPRFALVAAFSSLLRPVLAPRLRPMALAALFFACWAAFYAVYFALVAP